MSQRARQELNPDHLLTLLAVARLGRYAAAAQLLGVSHTTVSRRMEALEQSLGGRTFVEVSGGWEPTRLGRMALRAAEKVEDAVRGISPAFREAPISRSLRVIAPEGFSAQFGVPAIFRLQQRFPGLQVEVTNETRPPTQHRSGFDVEIVIGKPRVPRSVAIHLRNYTLALYAAKRYLDEFGVPEDTLDLDQHRLIYYVSSSLRVDGLGEAISPLPLGRPAMRSTSVFSQLAAARHGLGIGLLPDYFGSADPALVPVLRHQVAHHLTFWALIREEQQENPLVTACVSELQRAAREG